jgi:flagellin
MRINTNVSAMMAANNLSKVQDAVSQSMEKLSSGFRINKAADDAAGLGIANTLRADGRALSQASRNADQTTSLLQVAEGGTSTIESILERMKELATQSGSDTVDAAGRASINAEFTALRSEIDRTVSTTTFQGSSLLDGTFGTTAPQLAATDVTFTGGLNSTATAGAYTLSVSNAGIATLHRPTGSVPPTYTVDLNAPAGAVSYASGKASITFGTGNAAITVAATATSASDIAGIQKSLDAHGFTVTGAVAADSTTGTSDIAGATVTTLPSSLASGTLHFTTADSSVTPSSGLTASSYISGAAVGAQQAGGAYTLNVVSTDAAVDSTGNDFGGLAGIANLTVDAGQASGGYTVKLNASNELEVMHGVTSLGVSSVLNDAAVAAGGSFSIGGVSFDLKASGSGGYADLATLSTAIDGATGKGFTVDAQVRTLTLKDSLNATVGSTQDISAFDGSADIAFSQGGISFTIDKSISFSNISAQLNNKVLTVVGAHADLLDASNTVLATQSLTSYSAGSDVTIAGGGYSVTLAGANAATNTYANLKTALSTGTITATHVAAANAAAGTITGNGSATSAASFMVDSSGQYKTNDMVQLQALDLTVATLGLTTSDLSTADGARNALSTIDTAMGTVTTALGSIGANQNRIAYAQDNLKTKISNFAAAESVIRDVDMADEMTTFSKNNILAQAGTAMLAQANQSGQSVLKLLQ